MSRPELTGHAEIYYNAKEARKYDSSSRMIGIQREITERAIELLRLDDNNPAYVLDIGCGSGLSGQVLEEHGHVWVGCDISRDMLHVAKERMEDHRISSSSTSQTNDNNNNNSNDDEDSDDDEDIISGSTGDLISLDMGTGLPFRAASFDAIISISALQWLCYANTKAQIPRQRLTRFFSSLYTVLKRGGRAVLQFYPETAEQAVMISEIATRVGFAGGVVVDYPNSAKAKKHYLVLSFDRNGGSSNHKNQDHLPDSSLAMARMNVDVTGRNDGAIHNNNSQKQSMTLIPRKKKGAKTKEWIVHKKGTQRKQGKNVRPDTKYTARRRPGKF
jgi:18S rRNA (guanine1575-N7)-methyltransferase